MQSTTLSSIILFPSTAADSCQWYHFHGSCKLSLQYLPNATLERNSLRFTFGARLSVQYCSVLMRLCSLSNSGQYYGGAIYSDRSNFIIEQTTIRINYYYSRHSNYMYGGAIYLRYGNLDILNSNFSSNLVSYPDGHGGAIYASNAVMTVSRSYFKNNRAGSRSGHGGAIYFDGSSITVTNCTFINNIASGGGGGAIYSARRYTNVSLVNNIFSQNTAAYCGVIDVDEFYHRNIEIIGNTFIYNRAIGLTAGNNGGGVICIRNATMTISNNSFSHNLVVGDAGVIRVDESSVVIEKSIFNNNTAGDDGGVFHTYYYPTRYTIINSSFTNNQAGNDGGVMYVGRAGSHVIINQSTFSHNHANERGGVIAILGSTLQINGANVFNFENNTAELGNVVSACKSNVTVVNSSFKLLALEDPHISFCTLYDSYNITNLPTTVPNTAIKSTTDSQTEASIITTNLAPTAQNEDVTPGNHSSSTATEDHHITLSTKDSATPKSITVIQDDTNTTTEDKLITGDSVTIKYATTPSDMKHRLLDNPTSIIQANADSEKNLHYIIPVYASLGLSIMTFIFFGIIILIILILIVKVFRKVAKPPSRSRKNEYTLIEVQANTE